MLMVKRTSEMSVLEKRIMVVDVLNTFRTDERGISLAKAHEQVTEKYEFSDFKNTALALATSQDLERVGSGPDTRYYLTPAGDAKIRYLRELDNLE